MPREFRKRGRGGRRSKKDKDHNDELDLADPIIHQNPDKAVKDVMEIVMEGETQEQEQRFNDTNEGEPHQAQFPELTPDLKAYWKEIDEKLQELERLGFKPNLVKKTRHDPQANFEDSDEDEDEDERQLILRSSLNELAGHELSLATDPETSVILERIIYSMDEFAKVVLMDRFVEHFLTLCTHRHASHVIQTLLALSKSTLDLESRGKLQEVIDQNKQDDSELPLTSLLLAQISKDLMPHLHSLSQDSAGSHVLVVLLLLLFGKPIPEECYRSRKSARWRSNKGKFCSVFKEQKDDFNPAGEIMNYQVPDEAKRVGDSLYRQMKKVLLSQNAIGVRSAAINPSSITLLRIIIELEFDHGEAEESGSLTDKLLDGLMGKAETYDRSEFVEASLRDANASHLLEEILTRISPTIFSRFYTTYIDRRICQLCGHPVANFIVSKSIPRLDLEKFLPAFVECQKKMGDWIDNHRVGSLKSFVDRSKDFSQSEQEQVTIGILKAFGIDEENDYRYVFPCLISLMRLEYLRKTTSYEILSSNKELSPAEYKLPESSIQGSLLLQAIFQQDIPSLSRKIIEALMSLPLGYSLSISRDPIGSRVLDALINSTTTPPSSRRQLMLRFIGKYHILADDRIGSRIAESFWSTADVYLKEKIATSLIGLQTSLNRSAYAHFFLKKMHLPLFERQIDQWKQKMVVMYPSKKHVTVKPNPTELGKDRNESCITHEKLNGGNRPISKEPKNTEQHKKKSSATDQQDLLLSNKVTDVQKKRQKEEEEEQEEKKKADGEKKSKKTDQKKLKSKKAKKDIRDSIVDELFQPILKKIKTH